MSPWITVHVMNIYVDNGCIREDEKTQKKIYHYHLLFITPKYTL